MKTNYIIGIITDFGLKDGFAGAMKGVIYRINPDARIVDISNEISPQNIMEGSFILKGCARYFPENTIFLAVVDPGVGSARKNIIIKSQKYIFVGPDNGIFSFIYREEGKKEIIEITNKSYFLPEVSRTFHGRDIFAPVAAHLSTGVSPYNMGEKIDTINLLNESLPELKKNQFEGEILYIDKFGNLITNISEEFINKQKPYKNFTVNIKDRALGLSNSYSEVPPGEILAIKGSFGYIEIAVNQGNCRELLECGTGDKVYCVFK